MLERKDRYAVVVEKPAGIGDTGKRNMLRQTDMQCVKHAAV